MRCSSCESLLAAFLDGELSVRKAASITSHLLTCSRCSALLEELKVVDALLHTTAAPELPPNFTFAVMADVRSMPAPALAQRTSFVMPLIAYLIAAWTLLVAWALLDRSGARALPGRLVTAIGDIWHATLAPLAAAVHAGGTTTFALSALIVIILAADAIALAGLVIFYRRVRPRLVARLATVEETA